MERREKLVLAVVVAGMLLSLFVFVHPWFDFKNDASIYIITARSIAEGAGYSYAGVPFRIRPPGFSWILAPFVTGQTDFRALNLLVSLFGVAAVLLLYLHQRARVGWLLALCTSVVIWLNPGYQRLCNQVLSDVPGLALLLACLLIERRVRRSSSWTGEILLGVSIGVACYMRSAAILLVPAILAARLLARCFAGSDAMPWRAYVLRRWVPFAIVAWLVVLPWNIRDQRVAPPPPSDQTLNYSIGTAMWHRDPGDPSSPRYELSEIAARPVRHLPAIASVAGSRLDLRIPGDPRPSATARLGYGGISLLLLAGLLTVLVRRREPAELFAVGLLALLAFYFAFTDRLILPVYVLAFAATVELLRDLLRGIAGRKAEAVVAGLLLLVALVEARPRQDWDRIRERHEAHVELASAVESELEPDAVLASARGFHYGVFLNRPVISLNHTIRRGGRVDAAEPLIDKYTVNTVVLSPLWDEDRSIRPYFAMRYGAGGADDAALVWRVRP